MPGMVLSGNEEAALRLGAALIIGSIIGLNRELHGKPAGLRTHALVSRSKTPVAERRTTRRS